MRPCTVLQSGVRPRRVWPFIRTRVLASDQAYTGVPQTLADRMAEGLDIAFGCVVRRVAWSDAGVTVTCEDGRIFAAAALIVTVSLGVLKVTTRGSPPASECSLVALT